MTPISPARAEALILEKMPWLPAEDCPLAAAPGRVLRAPILAERDLPPFDRVTLDGYALRHAAWAAGERCFRLAGIQAAGMMPLEVKADNECIEIMTGAVLPRDADTVVPYEDATVADGMMTVAPTAPVSAGQAVHRRGTDALAGAQLVAPGVRLTGREIAVAAASGCTTLSVSLRPNIAVVTTGDELVDVGAPMLAPHHIRRSNDQALRAALLATGYPRVECFHLRDFKYELETQVRRFIAEFDVVILTGGVSKGKFDFLPLILEQLRVEKIFHRVAQRPGGPFWFGLTPRQTPVFALPGNPVSCYTCLHRYVVPALSRMSQAVPAPLRTVALTRPVAAHPEFTRLLPVRLASGAAGALLATPAPTNTSGDFTGLVGTDGFAELAPGRGEIPAGTVARFFAWE